jgi:tetratricopeptide (TPR) repeat protein
MELKHIKAIAEKGEYDRALTECEKLLRGPGPKKTDILRTRAYVFALSGDYGNAVKDRQAIMEMGEATVDDYFLAANNALSAGNVKRASVWLKEVLRLGEEQNETWFKSASLFLLAYSEMELRQFSNAHLSLSRAIAIEPACAMSLPGMGMCNHKKLEDEIRKRRDQRTGGKPKKKNRDSN